MVPSPSAAVVTDVERVDGTIRRAAANASYQPWRDMMANCRGRASALILSLVVSVGLAGTGNALPLIYIPNQDSNDISVADGATNSLVATIPSGFTGLISSPISAAVTPSGHRAYVSLFVQDVTLQVNGRVLVVDTASNAISSSTDFGTDSVGDLVANPQGTRVYAAVKSGLGLGFVKVIETAGNTVASSISTMTPVGHGPEALSIDGVGRVLYALNSNDTLAIIDTGTNSATTFTFGVDVRDCAVNSNGTRLYCSTFEAGAKLRVFDVTTIPPTLKQTLGLPGVVTPGSVAVNHSGSRIYVADGTGNQVSIVRAGTGDVAGCGSASQIAVVPSGGTQPVGFAINAQDTRVYISNALSNNVAVLNAQTNVVIASIAVGMRPNLLAVGPFPAQ